MRIRAGYQIIYDCPQPTPMLLMVSPHPSRVPDLTRPRTASPSTRRSARTSTPTASAIICTRIVAPAGRLTISTELHGAGQRRWSTPSCPTPSQHPVEELPDEVLVYLLGSRYCDTDRLSDTAWSLFGQYPARLGPGPGDLRLGAQPHRLRLRARQRPAHRLGRLHRTPRRLPRLRPPGRRLLPLHEHPGALLHRLARRHRRAAALWPDGFRRLVRGLSRRPAGTPSTPATTRRASAAS